MKSKRPVALSLEELIKMGALLLYGEREVVRDRCLIGYCQKLSVEEFLNVNGIDILEGQILFDSPGKKRRSRRRLPLHDVTRHLLQKYSNNIPVIEPVAFQKHFADLLIMAGIKKKRRVWPNSIRYSAIKGQPLHLKDLLAAQKKTRGHSSKPFFNDKTQKNAA